MRAGAREWAGLAVLMLPCLVVSMNSNVLNLALPQITADLRPTSVQLLWIVDGYGYLLAGALITMGVLGDRIGRRRLLLTGGAAFAIGSVAGAGATSAGMLIASRMVLGIAGATLMPSTLSLIRSMFGNPRQRTVALGVWTASFALGGVIAPVIGGVLLNRFWWGSVFLVAVPVMALLVAVRADPVAGVSRPCGRTTGSGQHRVVAGRDACSGLRDQTTGAGRGGPAAAGRGRGGVGARYRLRTPPAHAGESVRRPVAVPAADLHHSAGGQRTGVLRALRHPVRHDAVPAAGSRAVGVGGRTLDDPVRARLPAGVGRRAGRRQPGCLPPPCSGEACWSPPPGSPRSPRSAPGRASAYWWSVRSCSRSGSRLPTSWRRNSPCRRYRPGRPALRRQCSRPAPSSVVPSVSRSSAVSARWPITAGSGRPRLRASMPRRWDRARETLGGAVDVARSLPAGPGDGVLTTARAAYVSAFQLIETIGAALLAGTAVTAFVLLRRRAPGR